MTGQIVIQSSAVVNNRRQPLLPPERSTLSSLNLPHMASSPPRDKCKVGECAGGTAAECAAICCCCPCMLMEFLVLAFYKVPTGICRRIWKKRLLKNKKKGLLTHHGARDGGRSSTIHCFDDDLSEIETKDTEAIKVSIDGPPDVVDLDKEMWERFHNTGFWRSPSQRHL